MIKIKIEKAPISGFCCYACNSNFTFLPNNFLLPYNFIPMNYFLSLLNFDLRVHD